MTNGHDGPATGKAPNFNALYELIEQVQTACATTRVAQAALQHEVSEPSECVEETEGLLAAVADQLERMRDDLEDAILDARTVLDAAAPPPPGAAAAGAAS
jgi:hypothetical protein